MVFENTDFVECCGVCPMNSPSGPNPKRQKLDIPSELLRDDPHEKCPVPLPVGSEFMGQCPYLEGDIQARIFLFINCLFISIDFL